MGRFVGNNLSGRGRAAGLAMLFSVVAGTASGAGFYDPLPECLRGCRAAVMSEWTAMMRPRPAPAWQAAPATDDAGRHRELIGRLRDIDEAIREQETARDLRDLLRR